MSEEIKDKIYSHDVRIGFFDDGRAFATISFSETDNFTTIGEGNTHEEAAINAVSQVFQFAKTQAPHLLNEEICS